MLTATNERIKDIDRYERECGRDEDRDPAPVVEHATEPEAAIGPLSCGIRAPRCSDRTAEDPNRVRGELTYHDLKPERDDGHREQRLTNHRANGDSLQEHAEESAEEDRDGKVAHPFDPRAVDRPDDELSHNCDGHRNEHDQWWLPPFPHDSGDDANRKGDEKAHQW